ncbi:TPA: hypothetical protein RI304_003828 [Escherichia coli]|nr:hypothetical protein [Escherichia coli]
MALPFAADACLVASSFEADADDADDAAELADDAAAVFEDSALVSDAFAFVSDVFAAEADLAAALACTAAFCYIQPVSCFSVTTRQRCDSFSDSFHVPLRLFFYFPVMLTHG